MFCSNCGNEIFDNSMFCINCGYPVKNSENIVEQTVTNNRKIMYTKQEFYSHSIEYENGKNNIKENYNKKIKNALLITLIGGIGTILTPFLAFIIQGFCWIFFILLIGGVIYTSVTKSKSNKEVRKFGNDLYLKYMAEFNNANL